LHAVSVAVPVPSSVAQESSRRRAGDHRRRWPGLIVAAASLAVGAAFVGTALLPQSHVAEIYRFTIPAGTAARLAAGANISLFPERLVIDRGDVIDLVNQDEHDDEVGPFFVAAHGELREAVDRAGTYVGTCTLHRSGRVVIVVR
jgi:hypothetical protein